MIEELDTRYGTMYVPDTDNGQYLWLKNIKASPEDEFIEMVCNFLDALPKGVAIDVGANFGCWTLPLAKHTTEVLAFEPQKCVYKVLRKTCDANPHLKNISTFNFAVGAKPGVIKVPDIDMDDSTNFGGVSMGVPHPEHPEAPMYEIDVVPLDEIVLSNEHISFIKADVEGGEYDVLLGARETILRCKPILFVEAIHRFTDSDKLGNLIQSYSYKIEVHRDNFLGMPL